MKKGNHVTIGETRMQAESDDKSEEHSQTMYLDRVVGITLVWVEVLPTSTSFI